MSQRSRSLFVVILSLIAVVCPLRAVSGPHSVDALTADRSEVIFNDDGYWVAYESVSTGRQSVLTTHIVSDQGTDPNSLQVTFELVYSDGFQASGSGYLVIGSLPALAGPPQHPFGHLFTLLRLTVSDTNRPRGGPWPKPGDELVGEAEVNFDGFLEGAVRIVRPD
ncbi:MAG TPA: hypothetical protein VGL03_02490 [Thermoanaerobaculia bacterium]|jgi:hypothetical protein